jgi:hypothetical protein
MDRGSTIWARWHLAARQLQLGFVQQDFSYSECSEVDLSEAGAMPITLLNANEPPLAVPSAIDSDGASFDVTPCSFGID